MNVHSNLSSALKSQSQKGMNQTCNNIIFSISFSSKKQNEYILQIYVKQHEQPTESLRP